MTAHKISRKELKHDKLVDIVSSTASHFQRYGKVYISLGALLIIVAIALSTILYQQSRKSEEAAALLSRVPWISPPERVGALREICEKYPNTTSAPLARMFLAGGFYHNNQFDEAERAYQLFLEGYPHHQLAPFAQMGIAYCQESRPNWEKAITQYRRVGQSYPQSSLVAEAIFNIGRCQIQLDRVEDAIGAYEEVINLYPQSLYVPMAREQLVKLISRGGG